MKSKDITPLTVVYGYQPSYGAARKAVAVSTGTWTMNGGWGANRERTFQRHAARPNARYGVTIGVLVVSAELDVPDEDLLAAAAAVDVDRIQETGQSHSKGETISTEVIYAKDVVELNVVLAAQQEKAERKAREEADREARQASIRKLRELRAKLDIELPHLDLQGNLPLPHAFAVELLTRLAVAEGKAD